MEAVGLHVVSGIMAGVEWVGPWFLQLGSAALEWMEWVGPAT